MATSDNARSGIPSRLRLVFFAGAQPRRHTRNTPRRCRSGPVRLQTNHCDRIPHCCGMYSASEHTIAVVGNLRTRRLGRSGIHRYNHTRQRIHCHPLPCGQAGYRARLVAGFRKVGSYPCTRIRRIRNSFRSFPTGARVELLAFAIPALLGMLVIWLVPRSPATDPANVTTKNRGATPST